MHDMNDAFQLAQCARMFPFHVAIFLPGKLSPWWARIGDNFLMMTGGGQFPVQDPASSLAQEFPGGHLQLILAQPFGLDSSELGGGCSLQWVTRTTSMGGVDKIGFNLCGGFTRQNNSGLQANVFGILFPRCLAGGS